MRIGRWSHSAALILSIFLLNFLPYSFAASICNIKLHPEFSKKFSEMLGGNEGYGTTINFAHFEKSKKILLLGDGNNLGFSMGLLLHEQFPEKIIISTDKSFKNTIHIGNFTQMEMDNTEPFPFAPNYFDTIILRQGMCTHGNPQACGGFQVDNEEVKDFFERVIITLDKNNLHAVSILHGGHGSTPEIQKIWAGYLGEFENQYGVEAKLLSRRSSGVAHSIVNAPLGSSHYIK